MDKYNSGNYIENVSKLLADMRKSAYAITIELSSALFNVAESENIDTDSPRVYIKYRHPHFLGRNDLYDICYCDTTIGYMYRRDISEYHLFSLVFVVFGECCVAPSYSSFLFRSSEDIQRVIADINYIFNSVYHIPSPMLSNPGILMI